MKLAESLRPQCVKVPMASTDKAGAIRELVDLLAKAGIVSDAQHVYDAVLERESRRSTGIGMGLAVPHAKTSAVNRLVMAVGKPADPIDFDSRDNQPVSLIVLLISPPEQTGAHIQALATISRLITVPHVRTAIEQARQAEELYRIITQQDA